MFSSKITATLSLLFVGIVGFVTPNLVLSAPFTCEAKLYQSINTDLMLLDPETGIYHQVGSSASETYNAIGWDRRNNYIYGYRKRTKRLFKIGTSGQTIDLGTPKDINNTNIEVRSQAADMDANGNLWVYDHDEAKVLTRINVDTLKYKKIYFTGATPDGPNDIVYIKSVNSFFGINKNSNKLVRFNLNNNEITVYWLDGLPPQDYDIPGYGAGWTNINDELYFAYNDGGVYKINDYLTPNPIATWVIDSQASVKQDGASCPIAPNVFVPEPTTGNGTLLYANSGTGKYKDRILFMDWKNSSLKDGIQEGDVVNFTIPASSSMPSGTLKATFKNVDDTGGIAGDTKPTDMRTWGGAPFYQLYNTSGTGEAIYTPQINPLDEAGEHHLSFDITWEMTLDGQTVAPDILFMDPESTTINEERMDITTNGGVWSIIENAVNESYIVDGVGTTQIHVKDTEDLDIDDDNPTSTEGSPLLLTKGATEISVRFNTINSDGGKQAVAFALLVPRDHGDAPSSYGDAVHAFKEEAIGASKTELGLKFTTGTPYFGDVPPDSEAEAQDDENPSEGDDNNDDAFDTERQDDENIEIESLSIGQSIDITIPVSGSGFVQAWIDWNADGDFNDPNEQVATNVNAEEGDVTLALNVPEAAQLGQTYARFRISSQQNLPSSGYAKDGEVEDITIEITEARQQCRVDDLTDSLYSTSSVSANSTVLKDTTLVYQVKFNNSNWGGNVLAYNLETQDHDGSVKDLQWEAADNMPTNRRILTYYPGQTTSETVFSWDTIGSELQSILRNGQSETVGKKRLKWIRGDDEDEGSLFRTRDSILGDIINSNLIYLNHRANYGYSRLPEGGGYDTYLGSKYNRTPLLLVGANDGMLHGINATSGSAEWSYVPYETFSKLVTISQPNYGCKTAGCLSHEYLVDGKLALGDAKLGASGGYAGKGWKSVLVATLGKGGKGLFALTVGDEYSTQPRFLWEISATQAKYNAEEYANNLGTNIPQASIVRINNSNTNKLWAAVIGNGYESANHQAVLLIIDLQSGSIIKKINTGSGSEDNPNGLSAPIAVDTDNDAIVDRIYAGDLLGNLWAFDVSGNDPESWDVDFGGSPLFTASQPITAFPQVGRHPKKGFMVYFGTGKYFGVEDNFYEGEVGTNTFYGIQDKGEAVSKASLVEQKILQQSAVDGTDFKARITTKYTVDYSTKQGWYMDLPDAGERVISQALLRQGRLIFTTMTPPGNVCAWGGTSWLMEFDAIEGRRLDNVPIDINDDKEFNEADKVKYQDKPTIISGVQDVNLGVVFSTPAVISHDRTTEGKYLTGTGGSIGMFRESASSFKGRMSWRQIR